MVILDMTKGLNHIGRLGENEHRTFRFPDSCEVLAMYPEATVSVLVKRPGDSVAYPVAPGFVEIRNGAVYWTVQSADLARIGRGNVELTFVDGTTVAKNIIYDVYVDKALDGAGDPPEPWESWQTDITAIAGEIAGDRAAAEQSAEDAVEAKGKAEAAQEAAESAEQGAGESAGAADTSARAAAESAGAADRSAGAADQSAQAAGRSATAADQSAQAAAGSVTAAGEQAGAADASARAAAASALEAERMTFGTEGGVPVPATSPYNENNAKYWAQLTADAETTATQAIQAKGEEVLQSIPADYTALSGDVENVKSAIHSISLGVDSVDNLVYVYLNGVKQGNGIPIGGSTTMYSITMNLSHATSSSIATQIAEGKTFTTTISPDKDYRISTVTVYMGNVELTNVYDSQTGVLTIQNVSANLLIAVTTELKPIDLLDVTWANHAITCGQNTNNYNAWAPHNLQYDSVNDCFVFLQCHTTRHMGGTYSAWTLSLINPYDANDYEAIEIPAFNGLGMLFVENGVWTLMPRGQQFAYRSSDMGETWTTLTANIPQYLFGVYKCGDTYFGGNDSNNAITYYKSSDLLNWTEVSFDSQLGYSILCETSFCEFDGKYWAFNRTNDSTLGHPVILQSVDNGDTWTLFSDQELHGFRSTVSCYPFQNYIVVADIDRDNGILYYNKFDGEEFTQLNSWVVPWAGDDFHNVVIASNYQDTVILEFMHSAPISGTGSVYSGIAFYCDNVMIVGSTKQLPSFNWDSYIDTYADMYAYANEDLTSGLNEGTYEYEYAYASGPFRIKDSNQITSFVDEISLPLNLMLLTSSSSSWRPATTQKNGDTFAVLLNSANGTPPNINGGFNVYIRIGVVSIGNNLYMYGYGGHEDEIPVLIRVGKAAELNAPTPSSTDNSVIGAAWQEPLGFRRVISINTKNNGTHMVPFPKQIFNDTSTHKFAFISYTPVSG